MGWTGTTGEEKGRQDLVIVDARTDAVVGMIKSAVVYVHQMALDERTGGAAK